jgi:hypothetical protein
MQLVCAYRDTTRPKPTHEPGRSLFPRCRSTRVLLLLGRPAPQLSLLINREYARVRQKHLIRRTKIAPRIGRRKVDRTTKLAQPSRQRQYCTKTRRKPVSVRERSRNSLAGVQVVVGSNPYKAIMHRKQ